MISLLSRASLRYLARHPTQLALAVLGVALGVAVVVGIDTASASAQRAFELSGRALRGVATHVVRNVDESMYVELAREPDAPPMAPAVQATVMLPQHGGRTLELLGVDGFAEARVRPAFSGLRGANTLLAVERGAALEENRARELGLELGERFEIIAGSRVETLELAAILRGDNAAASAALAGLVVVDIAVAQDVAGQLGRLSRIDFVLDDASEARLSASLPPNVRLEAADEREKSTKSLTRAFEVNLRALSLLALLVGVFLVYNTMTFSVVQRRALWGSLRTLGATRGEVFRVVCREAFAVGVAGSALGVGLGLLLARELVELVTRTINDLYFVVEVRSVALEPTVLARAFALGVAASIAAAFAPARDAVASQPRAALSRSLVESKLRARAAPLAWLAVGIAVAAAGVLAISGRNLVASLAALFALLIASALATPLITVGLCKLIAPVAGRVGGAIGRMAARGIVASLSRTAVAIAALAVALSATAGMGVMVESFRSTVARWLRSTLRADVYVSAPALTATNVDASLDPALVERLLDTPGVAGANRYRALELSLADGSPLRAVAIDFDPLGRGALEFLAGESDEAWRAFEQRDVVFVSEPLSKRLDVGIGETLEFSAPGGAARYVIAAVFRDYSTDAGFAFLPRRSYAARWRDDSLSSLGLFAEPGAPAEELVQRANARLQPGELAIIRTGGALERASLEVFDQTFEVTRVLRLIAGGVAFLGVLCALLALGLEREREIGVLRAIGLGPGGVRALIFAQTGLMGAIAGLLALPIGGLVAFVLIRAVNERAFGWSLEIETPPSVFVETFALAVVASLLAGAWPAMRMSRIRPARALRAD